MSLIGREVFSTYKQLKKKYPDINDWCAEAVREEFGVELEGPIMTAKICFTKKLPWINAVVFENVALVLNGREAIPDVDQDISIKEICFAARCLNEEFPKEEFNDAVAQYFAAEAGEEGIVLLPKELQVGQKYIPVTYLNETQQDIQEAYLAECNDYVDLMSQASLINAMDTFDLEE